MKTSTKKTNSGNTKGYYDLGGNFADMTSQYTADEPVSGYGTVDSYDRPKRPKKPASGSRNTGPNRKNCAKGSNCFRNANKKSKMTW